MANGAVTDATFARHHRHDRTMIAVVVFVIWLAIVTGFAIDIVRRAHNGQLNFPLIVHLHVVAYGAWLLLLGLQVWLGREPINRIHKAE